MTLYEMTPQAPTSLGPDWHALRANGSFEALRAPALLQARFSLVIIVRGHDILMRTHNQGIIHTNIIYIYIYIYIYISTYMHIWERFVFGKRWTRSPPPSPPLPPPSHLYTPYTYIYNYLWSNIIISDHTWSYKITYNHIWSHMIIYDHI